MSRNIKIYDSTLRDGAQTKGVNFSLDDKQKIIKLLDDLEIDYIEAGWPGANPTDDVLFKNLPKLKSSKIVAFGMMRKKGKKPENDKGLSAILESGINKACLVGKSWDFNVKNALKISLEENLNMIEDIKWRFRKRT